MIAGAMVMVVEPLALSIERRVVGCRTPAGIAVISPLASLPRCKGSWEVLVWSWKVSWMGDSMGQFH